MHQYSEEVMKALDKSIEHWEENCRVDRAERQYGPKDCALCLMFHLAYKGDRKCTGCPIATKTGKANCIDTPYHEAAQYESPVEADQQMLTFLTDLRKELTNG